MIVIPIVGVAPRGPAPCDEPGAIQKTVLPLTRREFLQGSGILTGTLAAGSALALLAPSRSWAVELKTLSSAEGDALMKMGRVLYPHPKLPDAVYALLAKDLDAKAGSSADTLKLLRGGVAALDKAAGGNFAAANPAKQLEVVKAIEGQPFFNTVRGQCITSLYDNDMAWATFGYEGSSWEKGGYIHRGFQDLKWLPDPPPAASPPLAT
ncbi:MAG: twin-arginine translocation signal domain-containing protein [Gemmatimonadota bacterium]